LEQFFAYDPRFPGGVWVAAADLDNDSDAEIITGPDADPSSQPLVKVFTARPDPTNVKKLIAELVNYTDPTDPQGHVLKDANGIPLPGFMAYDANFTGGVRVAVGYDRSVPGQIVPEIITAPGPVDPSLIGAFPPLVKVFEFPNPPARGALDLPLVQPPALPPPALLPFPVAVSSFYPYGSNFASGIFVAAGDFSSSGTADILTGPGLGSAPEIKVFSGKDFSTLFDFMAFQPPVPNSITLFPDDHTWINGVGGVTFGSRDPFTHWLDIFVTSGPGQHTSVRIIRLGQTNCPPFLGDPLLPFTSDFSQNLCYLDFALFPTVFGADVSGLTI
jgi:hypothetical protein